MKGAAFLAGALVGLSLLFVACGPSECEKGCVAACQSSCGPLSTDQECLGCRETIVPCENACGNQESNGGE